MAQPSPAKKILQQHTSVVYNHYIYIIIKYFYIFPTQCICIIGQKRKHSMSNGVLQSFAEVIEEAEEHASEREERMRHMELEMEDRMREMEET